jgi:hypothetical protein
MTRACENLADIVTANWENALTVVGSGGNQIQSRQLGKTGRENFMQLTRLLRYLAVFSLLAALLLSSVPVLADDATPTADDIGTALQGTEEETSGGSEPATEEPVVGPPATQEEPADLPVTDPAPGDGEVPVDKDPGATDGTPETVETDPGDITDTATEDETDEEAQPELVDPIEVPIQAYNCDVDPGTGSTTDCEAAVGIVVDVSADGEYVDSVTTDAAGQTSIVLSEGSSAVFAEDWDSIPSGYVPQGNGIVSLTVAEDSSVVFINVAETEMGQFQLASGICPTLGEPRTEFTVVGPIVRAASACEANGGSAFTVTNTKAGGESQTLVTDDGGGWEGYLEVGSYTISNANGSGSFTVENGAITLVIATEYVAGPTGTLVIQGWFCTAGTEAGTEISAQSGASGPPNDSCAPSDQSVSIDSIPPRAAPINLSLGDDGQSTLTLAEGSYVVTDVASGASAFVDVDASGTSYVVIVKTVLTGDVIAVIYSCADSNSWNQDRTNPSYWTANCTSPISGLGVALLDKFGTHIASSSTSADGSVAFREIPPGQFTLAFESSCALFSGGADARGGFNVTAGGTINLAGFSCAGSPHNPGNGGHNPNPEHPGGGHSGGHSGDGSSTGGSGEALASVTTLPNTGAGVGADSGPTLPSLMAMLALGILALGLVGVSFRRCQLDLVQPR